MTDCKWGKHPMRRRTRLRLSAVRWMVGCLAILALVSSRAGYSGVDPETREHDGSSAPACVGEILKVVSGSIRLKRSDGAERISVKGSTLDVPLCILRTERRKFLILVPSYEGEWWIKRRFVTKSTAVPDITSDCREQGEHTMISSSRTVGGVRGSGEDPCE